MRKLASFEDAGRARALHEALTSEDIASELRPGGGDGAYAVWIVVEEQLLDAKQLLNAFLANPDAARFDNAKRAARAKPSLQPKPRPASAPTPRGRVIRARVVFNPRAFQGRVTNIIVLAAACVYLLDFVGLGDAASHYLSIASYEISGGFARWHGYDDLLSGQVWRLFSPILLHFGIVHLLFNIVWMLDLGAAVERFQGPLQYAGFVLFCAAVSNLAQLELGLMPNFGGLSGIVYAFVGYVWARGRFDPVAGIAMRPQLMTFFMFWLVLGFTGVIDRLLGPVANYCHLGGLVAGAIYGYVAARRATRLLRR